MLEEVTVEKLIHGGQGIGLLEDGRKALLWNVLPGEKVKARLTKKKRSYVEGFAEEILISSDERIEPKDEAYLSTSPWQIMTFTAENNYKQQILTEAFEREDIIFAKPLKFHNGNDEWLYRNKMEYSFWADDFGLHLALFHRASHGKRIVQGSSIARPEIDKIANEILEVLNGEHVRGSQLKTLVLRCNKKGETVVALFVKDPKFPNLKKLKELCRGIVVCYSNPKSPASIISKELYQYGDVTLVDDIMGKQITYDVHSFFQVNLPVFEQALNSIKTSITAEGNTIDFYCGVGTIGICVGDTNIYIEIDAGNCNYAKHNAGGSAEIIQASSEKALDYITKNSTLIVDPPRSGLHRDLITHIREVRPRQIIYLSCNPSTQARDISLIKDIYKIKSLEGYNFFPRTPHIESLALLDILKP